MKIGITGGLGFIGRHVTEQALQNGHEVLLLDRTARPSEHYPDNVEVFIGDATSEPTMREFAAHVDGVIHLAAVLGTQETVKYPTPAATTNLLGGLAFLEAVSQYELPAAYIAVGNWWMNNPYSISKNMIERFVAMYNADRGARVNVVRALNAYGPGQSIASPFGTSKVRKITPAFVCRALTGQPLVVYGDGSQVSDMVWVKDVARALLRSIEQAYRGVVFDTPVEVGPKQHQTVQETATKVIEEVVKRGYPPVPIENVPMRPGEIPGAKVIADTTTLALVGLNADDLMPFDQGIAETVDWFIETKGTHWTDPR